MENEKDLAKVFGALDSILGQTDLSDVTAESNSFSELPDGYYLVEVEKAELKESKSSHQPMVAFQMNVVEDGYGVDENSDFFKLSKTKGRKIFMYYVLKDSASVRRFVTDMLKFEGETPGEPLLGPEYFMTEETFPDALGCLIGSRIYIQACYKEYQGKKNCWYDVVGWDRAKKMGLPE